MNNKIGMYNGHNGSFGFAEFNYNVNTLHNNYHHFSYT